MGGDSAGVGKLVSFGGRGADAIVLRKTILKWRSATGSGDEDVVDTYEVDGANSNGRRWLSWLVFVLWVVA